MANEKILIVDDDLDTLKLVGVMLQRKGYRILAANSGAKALAMVKESPPDLILLDVMMPDMDGFEVTRRLRADPETASIPILMFTAKSQVDDKLTGFDAGADDYLTKPAHPAELLARVKKLLAHAPAVASSHSPASPPPPPGWTIGVVGAKGGVGVTTIALSLGLMLHQETKESVVIAELRPGQGTMGLELGHPALGGLASLLGKSAAHITPQVVQDALVSYLPNVRLLLASYDPAETPKENIATMEAIVRHLRHMGKFIVLDLGPTLQPVTHKILPLCDEILLVIENYPHAIKIAKNIIDYLLMHGIGQGRMSGVLNNRTRSDVQLSWTEVQTRLGIPIATVIPPVPEIAYRAQKSGKPIILLQPHGLVASQMGRLVRAEIQKAT